MLDPKRCPNCRAMLTEAAMSCGLCGHLLQDRQKAVKPEAVIPIGTSRTAPPAPEEAASYESVPRTLAPDYTPNYMLEEYRRQYLNLTYIQLAGALGFFTGLFALALVVWAIIQKPNLRARVAALGVDPQEWAAPMDALFWRVVTKVVVIYLGLVVVGLIIWGIAAIVQGNL